MRIARRPIGKALRQAVKPGSAELDIGTGILSLLSCQCEARRFYPIEPGNVIEVALELAMVVEVRGWP